MTKHVPKRLSLDDPTDEELLLAAQRGQNPYGNLDEDVDGPDYGFDTNELVWRDYGIKPNLPLKVKVETLMVTWRVDAYEIARVLKLEQSTVEDIIQTLNAEWSAMGRVLSAEERDLGRGRMVAELNRMVADIDTASAGATSADKARLLNLRMSCLTQLTNLQGLTLARNETRADGADEADPIEKAINAMDRETQERLHARLSERPSISEGAAEG